MNKKTRHSLQLIKSCLDTLKKDPELLVYPFLGFLLSSLLLVLLVAPFLYFILYQKHYSFGLIELGIFFIFFMAQIFINTFFGMALINAVQIRLVGGDPTIGDGLTASMVNVFSLLKYSFLSATLGFVFQWSHRPIQKLNQYDSKHPAYSWDTLSYLLLPCIAQRQIGFSQALPIAEELIGLTWGHCATGKLYLGRLFRIFWLSFALVVILTTTPLFVLGMHDILTYTLLSFSVFFSLCIYFQTTVQSVYAAALYHYTITLDVPISPIPHRGLEMPFYDYED